MFSKKFWIPILIIALFMMGCGLFNAYLELYPHGGLGLSEQMNVFVRLTTGIVYVEIVILVGFLVFLCYRTRSKGLVCVIAACILIFRPLGWIVVAVRNAIWGQWAQWEPNLDLRGVSLQRGLDIAIITSGIETVLCYSLILLGAFLIYNEWQHGKFNYPLSGRHGQDG